MADVSHEFGGQHTEIKLAIVESYLKAYTLALRNKFKELWYIDAFAGTGSRTTRTVSCGGDILEQTPIEIIEQRRGSVQIAIDIRPKFDRLVFIEKNPAYCTELRRLKDQNKDKFLGTGGALLGGFVFSTLTAWKSNGQRLRQSLAPRRSTSGFCFLCQVFTGKRLDLSMTLTRQNAPL